MEDKGSFEYSRKVIGELRQKAFELVDEIEAQLGESGREGSAAVKAVLEKFVLK
jgi:geranylgeranyl diphosphate synthase, type III